MKGYWGSVARVGAFLAALACVGPAAAEGVFINAPNRVDFAYDDIRNVLYIGSGGSLLRYDLASGSFLTPIGAGTTLSSMDLSPDGQKLVVADRTLAGVRIVDLATQAVQTVNFTRASGEGGTFSAAYGADGSILTSSTYQGSGWVPLRRYVPSTGVFTTIASITQNSMLTASADRSVIGFEESNISSGPFGRYRVSDGNLLRAEGYSGGTSWFNYEIGVNRNGTQYAIPTYGGTFIADAALVKQSQVIGVYAGGQPIGVAYHPTQDRVYFPWADSSLVYVFDTGTFTLLDSYDFEGMFDTNGNYAFGTGRTKTSKDGKLLFSSVPGGIRYVTTHVRPPSDITATAGNAAVTLGWTAAPGATSYELYQSTSATTMPATPAQTGITGTTVTVSGLANGTTYYFALKTVSAAGASTPSNKASATPLAPPAGVVTLQATARNGTVDLAWSAAARASEYVVYQGTTSGALSPVATGVIGTSYTATSLVNGTTYFFQVAGVNNSGTGARSAEVSATPVSPPDQVTGLSATPGDARVVLNWTPVAGATGYAVYLGTSPGNPSPYAAQTTSSNAATITGLGNGTTYYFSVTAANGAGEGPVSAEVGATPTPTTTVAIWLSQASVPVGQVASLNWSASNATSCSASGAWSGGPSLTGSQSVSHGTAGTYTYMLTCTGPNGSDTESATLTVTPAPPVAPALTLTVAPNRVPLGSGATLEWSANTGTCTASGDWSGSRDPSGSVYVQPASVGNHTYALTCANSQGSVTRSATLAVYAQPLPNLSIALSPSSIVVGQAAILSWSTADATSCMASDAWTGARSTATSSIAVQPATAGGYTYTLSCTGPGGTTTASAALQVNATPSSPPADSGGSFDPRVLLGVMLLALRRRGRTGR